MKQPIERPIDLPAAVITGLLQARRDALVLPMAPQPVLMPHHIKELEAGLIGLGLDVVDLDEPGLLDTAFREGLLPSMRCPWGRGGDVLWCREPWAQVGRGFRHRLRAELPDDGLLWHAAAQMPRQAARAVVKVDDVGVTRRAGVWCWVLEVERVQ